MIDTSGNISVTKKGNYGTNCDSDKSKTIIYYLNNVWYSITS